MVKGLGIDIVEISRIETLIQKYSGHFTEKVFTLKEVEFCASQARPAVHFAGRWAAKEAFYKALPAVCQPESSWKSVEIVPRSQGRQPEIRVCSRHLEQCLSQERISRLAVSISHERNYCVAVCLLE